MIVIVQPQASRAMVRRNYVQTWCYGTTVLFYIFSMTWFVCCLPKLWERLSHCFFGGVSPFDCMPVHQYCPSVGAAAASCCPPWRCPRARVSAGACLRWVDLGWVFLGHFISVQVLIMRFSPHRPLVVTSTILPYHVMVTSWKSPIQKPSERVTSSCCLSLWIKVIAEHASFNAPAVSKF